MIQPLMVLFRVVMCHVFVDYFTQRTDTEENCLIKTPVSIEYCYASGRRF